MIYPRTVIALDVGERRIGVALASMEARIASPLLTIDRNDTADVFADIAKLVEDHAIESIVVGLPRGMEGQETDQTRSSRDFASKLQELLSVKVYMQDEAGTSLAAEDELKASTKPYQKGDIDKLAATYILSDWLVGQGENL